ncbi:TetR/AcrR family transcriptional regulator [Mucilaginibacter sp. X4EP1]|uniref:TetR/AcrR family transcriptional regulator n=1 Tax=Mucilaginibacter sp. X4EP1 TaxID=2723092 RepID=UPI002168F260|nr:TetR/AcrR family transcriptional regulator [Mucilaginibacter sp. X4EP1]MCS3813543.1 AcrR family transcriptional regulator [Mucilaginibacter sp. X4EP1]
MAKIVDQSTEQKIKEAAQRVFIRKGYAAATTREIADEAGINNALLNYYFRTKEKLFDIVMQEQVATLFGKIYPIINNEETTLEEKISAVINYYTAVLLEQPGLTLFVLNEMQNKPERIAGQMKTNHVMMEAVIARQLREVRPDIHPMQLIMSIMGMALFPFMGRAVFEKSAGIDETAFTKMLKDRANLLPVFIKSILKG